MLRLFLLLSVIVLTSNASILSLPMRSSFPRPSPSHRTKLASMSNEQKSEYLIEQNKLELQEIYEGYLRGCSSHDFAVDVNVGGTNFSLIVDTGSTTLAIAATGCSCAGASPTYSFTGTTGHLTASGLYGDQSYWNGVIYTDTVSIGFSPLLSMSFAAIQSQSGFFNSRGCHAELYPTNQGIIGLGYPSLALKNTDTFVSKFFGQQTQLEDKFAISMCQFDGQLWLGGYDSSRVKSSLVYTPITQQSYYVVTMNALSLGTRVIKRGSDYFGQTIVDSGTTMILFPQTVYDSLTKALNNNPVFSRQFPSFWSPTFGIRCSQPVDGLTVDELNAALPPLIIDLDGAKLSLRPVSSYLRLDISVSGIIRYCWGVMGTSGYQTILGWGAMNQYVTVFDRANERVGFGETTCPIEYSTQYFWDRSPWDECRTNTTCKQYRTVNCNSTHGAHVDETYCDFLSLSKPPVVRDCCSDPNPDPDPDDPDSPGSNTSPFDFLNDTQLFIAFVGGIAAGVVLLVIISCCCYFRRLKTNQPVAVDPRGNVAFRQLPLLEGKVERSDQI